MKLIKQISNNHIIAITIGLVYFWFGALKYFSGMSPAEELAKKTIDLLTFSLIPSNVSIILLAIWETLIGLLLISDFYRRPIIIIALVHLAFTFSPLFLFPQLSFGNSAFTLTLLGQYIIKNIIIIGALLTLYKIPATTNKRY